MPALTAAEGLALGENGGLLVTSRSSNSIHEYDLVTGEFRGVLSAHHSLNEPTYIAFGSLPVDCNTNGIPDDCDITAGTSGDVDGDGIPDECGMPSGMVRIPADDFLMGDISCPFDEQHFAVMPVGAAGERICD